MGFPRWLSLREVFVDQPGHLEHRHLVLAEHRAQPVIGTDHALVLGVLQVVGLDVVPDLLCHFGTRTGLGTDHGGQFGTVGVRAALKAALGVRLAAGFWSEVLLIDAP